MSYSYLFKYIIIGDTGSAPWTVRRVRRVDSDAWMPKLPTWFPTLGNFLSK